MLFLMVNIMSYENKIQKELERHERQWHDAICPNVTKYGKQADNEIEVLKRQLDAALLELKGEQDAEHVSFREFKEEWLYQEAQI